MHFFNFSLVHLYFIPISFDSFHSMIYLTNYRNIIKGDQPLHVNCKSLHRSTLIGSVCFQKFFWPFPEKVSKYPFLIRMFFSRDIFFKCLLVYPYVLLSCLHILNFLCQNVCSAVKLLSGLDDQILQNPEISAFTVIF